MGASSSLEGVSLLYFSSEVKGKRYGSVLSSQFLFLKGGGSFSRWLFLAASLAFKDTTYSLSFYDLNPKVSFGGLIEIETWTKLDNVYQIYGIFSKFLLLYKSLD